MKPAFIALLLLFYCYSVTSQSRNVARIKFNTSQIKLGRGNVCIEIKKYQPDTGNYVTIKKINITKPVFTIEIPAAAPLNCKLYVKRNDTSFYDSPNFCISNEDINVSFDSSDVLISSKQNDFFLANMFVYLSMPAEIVTDPNFSYSLLKQGYQLSLVPWYKYGALSFSIKEYERNIINTVKLNRGYFRTLEELYRIRGNLTPQTLDTCFSLVKDVFKQSPIVKDLEDYIIQSKKIFIGKQLPLFTVLTEKSDKLQSDGFYKKHQYTFIDFWASWCMPCRAQIKQIKSIYSSIDTANFQLISISIDEQKDRWLKTVAQDSAQWQNFIDVKGGWQGNVGRNFNLTAIPSNVLVDSSGKIVSLNLSFEQLTEFLKEHSLLR